MWYNDILLEQLNDIDDRKKYFINNKLPELIYILPVNFDYKENAKVIFDKDSELKRQKLINKFKNTSNKFKIITFDNIELFEDGIHLNYEGHKKMSDEVESLIKNSNL